MIRANNISVQVTKRKIVDQVSISIEPGILTAVIGKNGAGKSSVIKAICNDLAHSGEVTLDNKPIQDYNLNDLAKIRAVVSQKVTMEFNFSVREMVGIGRSPYFNVLLTKRDEDIIKNSLEKADALHLIDQSYITLSGGEQQRVQFARALAQIWGRIEQEEPSYLLLDEPLASLDVAHQHEMLSFLQELCKKNTGVLIVIHDLNLAAQYSDCIHLLKDGKTVQQGSVEEVFTTETMSFAFDYPLDIISHPNKQNPLIIAKKNS